MAKKQDKSLNILLIVGLVVASALLGFIVTPYITNKNSTASQMPSYTSGGFTIRTTMPKAFVTNASSFLTSAVKPELLPKELIIIPAQKNKEQSGDAYLASWNQNGTYISYLLTLTLNNKNVNYQRVWIMPEARKLTDQSAATLLQGLFQTSYLSTFGTVTCADSQQNGKTLTDCSKLKTTDSGDMYGITVRSPIELLPPPGTTPPAGSPAPTATVISACYIPKAGTPSYTAPYCI